MPNFVDFLVFVGLVMLRFGVPLPTGAALDAPHLFLETPNVVDYPAAQSFSRNGDWIIVETRAKGDAAGSVQGLLKLSDGRGLTLPVQSEIGRVIEDCRG